MLFQDKHFFYLRKPGGRPSSWGQEESFLDKLENGVYEEFLQVYHHSDGYDKNLYEYFHYNVDSWGLRRIDDVHACISYLLHTFSHAQEYGLVNRLDTDTAGFLYFAKDVYTYSHYRKWQSKGWTKKHYLGIVQGDISFILKNAYKKKILSHELVYATGGEIQISYPLMHHIHANDRMVVIKTRNDITRGRGKMIKKTTKIHVLGYNHFQNRSLLHIEIGQGARHQIRAHLGALGYPLLGEKIYAKKGLSLDRLPLHLWSIGCELCVDHKFLEHFYMIREKANRVSFRIPGDSSPNINKLFRFLQ